MNNFLIDEQGTAAIEYALLISLIGMAIAGSLQVLGGNVVNIVSVLDKALSLVQFTDDDPLKRNL
jgi:Flp pilus assembly pilin Flp